MMKRKMLFILRKQDYCNEISQFNNDVVRVAQQVEYFVELPKRFNRMLNCPTGLLFEFFAQRCE